MKKPLFELLESIAGKLVKKVGKKGGKNIERFFFNDENKNPINTSLPEDNPINKLSFTFDNYISTSPSFEEQNKRIETNFDNLSFSEAFSSARKEAGGEGGHWFEFHGNWYNTFLKEEWVDLGEAGQQDFTKDFLQDLEQMKLEVISPIVDLDWSNIGDIESDISSESEIEQDIVGDKEVIEIEDTNEGGGIVHNFLSWINDLLDLDSDD